MSNQRMKHSQSFVASVYHLGIYQNKNKTKQNKITTEAEANRERLLWEIISESNGGAGGNGRKS